jgi:DNA-binding NarL/FixJ family response regulator
MESQRMTTTDSTASAARARVMIVVASAPLRAAIHQCLLAIGPGCDYLEAASPGEALALAGARPFDLVLLDVRLPGSGSAAIVAELLRLCPQCLVYLLDEPRGNGSADAAAQAGAHGSLSKDHLYEDLGALLRDFARRRALPQPEPQP